MIRLESIITGLKISFFESVFVIYLLLIPQLSASGFGETDSVFYNNDDIFIVDSIKISGNEKTENHVISRELNFDIGDTVSGKMLNFCRERIYSLGLFSNVKIIPHLTENSTEIEINLRESWYIYPLPYLNIENSSFKRASYGFNLLIKNFRGRNETISTFVTFGYNPTVSLQYQVPLLFPDEDISFLSRIFYGKAKNKSLKAENILGREFNNKLYGGEIILGKRLNIYNTVYAMSAYNYQEADIPEDDFKNKICRVPSLGVSYELDTRDLKQFPAEGYFITGQWLYNGFGINNRKYSIIKADYREYRRITENLLTKWRLTGRHAFGKNIPAYDHSFFGYDEIVRGHKDDVREGNNYLMASFEVKYPVIEDWDVSVKLPLLPRSLTSARVAVYIETFGDTGLTFNNNEKVSLKQLYSGYGAGLTFLVFPYNVFRVAYAFNEYSKGEIIFATGFSF